MSDKELQKGITVAISAYHEAENLKWLLPLVKDFLMQTNEEYDIIVIDTKESTDETPDVCKANGVLYLNQEFEGYAGAVKTAIIHAKRKAFFMMDADGSHNPSYIPGMYGMYEDERCDLVIGSRYIPGGETVDSAISVMLSKILNMVFRMAIGTGVRDISSGFKIYDTEKLRSIDIDARNFEIHQEILLKLMMKYPALRVREYPIRFEKRVYDRSKRNLLRFGLAFFNQIISLQRIKKNKGE